MSVEELKALKIGEYNLTDHIDNYKYILNVKILDDGSMGYFIQEKGRITIDNISIIEQDGELYGIAGVGGIHIISNDLCAIIGNLKIIKP